jgi:23S rRNA (guanosine2251-2'-O)-methyltransferase
MDPQNFGAVIRSAVALGATAILWPEHSSAPLSPATFRASAGAIEHAALCRVPALAEALQALASRGVTAVALDAQGTVELRTIDLTGPVVIVIGAEDKGVRRPVRAACQHTARLPMRGPIGSLNASVAGAIALYEVVRQRSAPASA